MTDWFRLPQALDCAAVLSPDGLQPVDRFVRRDWGELRRPAEISVKLDLIMVPSEPRQV